MALVTYILISALQTGLEKRFNPEVLGLTASKALAVLLLEFVTIKLGCYFLNIQGQGQVVDVFAYGGYKFIGYAYLILSIPAATSSHLFSSQNYRYHYRRSTQPGKDPLLGRVPLLRRL